jgi:hypothetical protein
LFPVKGRRCGLWLGKGVVLVARSHNGLEAGDGYAIAEIAVWMARIIESLVAEGALPDGHGQARPRL